MKVPDSDLDTLCGRTIPAAISGPALEERTRRVHERSGRQFLLLRALNDMPVDCALQILKHLHVESLLCLAKSRLPGLADVAAGELERLEDAIKSFAKIQRIEPFASPSHLLGKCWLSRRRVSWKISR